VRQVRVRMMTAVCTRLAKGVRAPTSPARAVRPDGGEGGERRRRGRREEVNDR